MADIDLNTLALLGIAGLNAFTAWVAWQTRDLTKKTETNTNSMREQLVTATGLAAHAAGLEEGRVEGKATAATLAKGVKQGRDE
jgi:hypothetical protein